MDNGNTLVFTEKPTTFTRISVYGKGYKETFYVSAPAENAAFTIKNAFGWRAETAHKAKRGRPRKTTADPVVGVGGGIE